MRDVNLDLCASLRVAAWTLVAGAVFGALVAVTSGCGGGLPAADVKDIENAARTSAAAYRYVDGGPASVLIRTTHCSIRAVIRDQKLPPVDAGIACESP